MPPSVKFTKEEIVNAALQVVREKGAAALTTRQIAAVLGVSTRPIFTYFQNMQQVQEAVRQAAQALYHSYIKKGLEQVHPFIGLGEQYIRFATQEPELYRLLFYRLPQAARTKPWKKWSAPRTWCWISCNRSISWTKPPQSDFSGMCGWLRTALPH